MKEKSVLPSTITIENKIVRRHKQRNYDIGDLFLAASYQPPSLYVSQKIRQQIQIEHTDINTLYTVPSNREKQQKYNLIKGVKRFLQLPETDIPLSKKRFEWLQSQASYRKKLSELRQNCLGLVTHFGSHRGNTESQMRYVQSIAEIYAQKYKLGGVTGGGSGMMESPLKGIRLINQKYNWNLPTVGLSEPKLLIHEPPNEYVNDFFIYPDMDTRKSALIEAGDTLVAHEGGVGTIEELIQTLIVLLDPRNKNKPYKIHLVYSNQKYFQAIHDLLKSLNIPLNLLKNRLTFSYKPKPEIMADVIKKSVMEVIDQKKSVLENASTYLEYPDEVFVNDTVKISDYKQALASIHFMSEDYNTNLRQIERLMYLMVDLTAKYKNITKEWNEAEFPTIYGKKELIQAIQKLIDLMVKQNRMKFPTKNEKQFFYLKSLS